MKKRKILTNIYLIPYKENLITLYYTKNKIKLFYTSKDDFLLYSKRAKINILSDNDGNTYTTASTSKIRFSVIKKKETTLLKIGCINIYGKSFQTDLVIDKDNFAKGFILFDFDKEEYDDKIKSFNFDFKLKKLIYLQGKNFNLSIYNDYYRLRINSKVFDGLVNFSSSNLLDGGKIISKFDLNDKSLIYNNKIYKANHFFSLNSLESFIKVSEKESTS